MRRVIIRVEELSYRLTKYDQIRIYRADSKTGSYSEITNASTRIALSAITEVYQYMDETGDETKWYKHDFYNSSTTDSSAMSDPVLGGQPSNIGYTFGTYTPPDGEWGEILTADDMRNTYLWGIDEVAQDVDGSVWTDEQYQNFVEFAMAEFERYLSIDIRKRVYKCRPSSSLVKARKWRSGVDYTDEEQTYPFDRTQWRAYGMIQLRHKPVISVERCILLSVVASEVYDLYTNGWVRLEKDFGQINLFPTGDLGYGPFNIYGGAYQMAFKANHPQGYEIDYTTGFETSDFVPNDLRSVIGSLATIKALASIGDGLLAGFSSSSVSIDGLSESFSSTQSATSAYFGARIKELTDEIQEWLRRNRLKYDIPISFVGTDA